MSDIKEYRIFGPPGTGKTTYLAEQIAAAARKYDRERIIVCSFTRAAAHVIGSRDNILPYENINTLHGHAYRALLQPALTENHISDWNKYAPYFELNKAGRRTVDDPLVGDVDETDTDADALYQQMGILRATLMPSEYWPQSVRAFGEKWNAWKKQESLMDFTDLIEQCLLSDRPPPQEAQVIIVDEAQDFTQLELALVRKWGWHPCVDTVLIAGDDDQAIYAWKGASHRAFLEPDLPQDQKRILNQSYRIPQSVHTLSQEWISHVSERENKVYKPRQDAIGEVLRIGANIAMPDRALKYIRDALDADRSFMVLASCGYMLTPLIRLLRRDGIPFHNPYAVKRGDWNPIRQPTVDKLLDFMRPDATVYGDEARLWNGGELRNWSKNILFAPVFARGFTGRLNEIENTEVKPLEWYASLFKDGMSGLERLVNEGTGWYARNQKTGSKKGLEYPLRILQKRGVKALTAGQRVVVGTIHSAKGGESDEVLLFPDLSTKGYAQWQGTVQQKDAVYRVFYVGMTRARERLILGAPYSYSVTGW